jgi:hypothetical protein
MMLRSRSQVYGKLEESENEGVGTIREYLGAQPQTEIAGKCIPVLYTRQIR